MPPFPLTLDPFVPQLTHSHQQANESSVLQDPALSKFLEPDSSTSTTTASSPATTTTLCTPSTTLPTPWPQSFDTSRFNFPTRPQRNPRQTLLESVYNLSPYSHSPRRPFRASKERRKTVRWSTSEVLALLHGVDTYGCGKWSAILKNCPFNPVRTSVDLKDKWRNLTAVRGSNPPALVQEEEKWVVNLGTETKIVKRTKAEGKRRGGRKVGKGSLLEECMKLQEEEMKRRNVAEETRKIEGKSENCLKIDMGEETLLPTASLATAMHQGQEHFKWLPTSPFEDEQEVVSPQKLNAHELEQEDDGLRLQTVTTDFEVGNAAVENDGDGEIQPAEFYPICF